MLSCHGSDTTKGRTDCLRDVQEGLEQLTALTALTFLRRSNRAVLSQHYVGEIPGALARTLEPLYILLVLCFMLPCYCCIPLLSDVTTPARNDMDAFLSFAERLDDVVLREVGKNVVYPVAHFLQDIRVTSLEWSNAELLERGYPVPHPRDVWLLENITMLSRTTELHIRLHCVAENDVAESYAVGLNLIMLVRGDGVFEDIVDVLAAGVSGSRVRFMILWKRKRR